jgi:hypothetical protein
VLVGLLSGSEGAGSTAMPNVSGDSGHDDDTAKVAGTGRHFVEA